VQIVLIISTLYLDVGHISVHHRHQVTIQRRGSLPLVEACNAAKSEPGKSSQAATLRNLGLKP
jgi:hypothetical protein